VQTFLPLNSFRDSAAVLDRARLGKQRVEAYQIRRALAGEKAAKPSGWQNHPAVRMWRGYEIALAFYQLTIMQEWESRGYRNIKLLKPIIPGPVRYPPFMGDSDFHASHRSNLLRKNPDHYQQFDWAEPPDLPYVWPV
jgi:hypothetical protein